MPWLERAIRGGAVPLCSGGAAVCLALYGSKVALAAGEWGGLVIADGGVGDGAEAGADDGRRPIDRSAVAVAGVGPLVFSPRDRSAFASHSDALRQHAATCAALSIASGAACLEAASDWRVYRSLPSLQDVEDWLARSVRRSPPFFLRGTVLVAAAAGLWGAERTTGAVRFRRPEAPIVFVSDGGGRHVVATSG